MLVVEQAIVKVRELVQELLAKGDSVSADISVVSAADLVLLSELLLSRSLRVVLLLCIG